MRILVFTEGTIIMHRGAAGHTRDKIVRQVEENEESVHDFASYVPIGNAVRKLVSWERGGAEILYLTSRRKHEEIESIRSVLKAYGFPEGRLLFRQRGKEYRDIAERIVPDILVEDDCESIGGINEMTITQVRPDVRNRIKSITVREFRGIDHLPENTRTLLEY